MSSHFSANQYENGFRPTRLKNWTVPRKHKERPSTLEGFTQFIATDRGHLKSSVPRSEESPWGTFMGTWDMPRNIPPARPSYTARSNCAAENLKYFRETSALNHAVNGYKPFKSNKSKKLSPVQRPAAPTPPTSPIENKTPQPSGTAVRDQENIFAPATQVRSPTHAKSPLQSPTRSPVPAVADNCIARGSPSPRKSVSPRVLSRNILAKAASPVGSVISKPPTPRMGSAQIDRPASIAYERYEKTPEVA